MMFTIDAIAQRVATQPNDCTAEPYFVVKERVIITGMIRALRAYLLEAAQ